MAVRDTNVLVFGPTGSVGRAAAIEASKRGANVWLGMRDTRKVIKGLGKDTDESAGFFRVQADLSQPDSLTRAVKQSGATTAFVYTIWDSEDNMKASFDALKKAGITYVVLLSSFSVRGPAQEERNMANTIPRCHAQTEIALEETGIPFAAVRPAYFNTNIFWYTAGIMQGEVEILHPSIKFDYLTPDDIGAVCGALLVKPHFLEGGQNSKTITLNGPELLSQYDAFEIITRSLARPIKIKPIEEEEFLEKMKGMPEPIARSIANELRTGLPPKTLYPQELHEEAVANIKKYAGREPTKFADWFETTKVAFA